MDDIASPSPGEMVLVLILAITIVLGVPADEISSRIST